MTIHKETDVVIVGSGPGGATLTRSLAQSNLGIGITLLERGKDWRKHPLYGTYAGALLYTDRGSFLYTREGLAIIRPLMLGGATSMYCGCSAQPLPWWSDHYGIDLDPYARQVSEELNIAPLPEQDLGNASTRIAEAGRELGMDWVPQDKFVWPSRARQFACSAKCMLGCRCRAKWNAAEYVDDAVNEGIDLWTGAKVDKVLHENGQITGVKGRLGREKFVISASVVVISAGGIGTPLILRASGLRGAGQGMAMDTTTIVYGEAPFSGNGREPPMTWSYADDDLGAMYSTLIDPWLNYPLAWLPSMPSQIKTWPRWERSLGVMIKLKDEVSGHIDDDGRISKGLTETDWVRQRRSESIARQILIKAGCDANTILIRPQIGTHPSATVRIDTMLNRDLETEINNLFVCDASVFPEALGRPTVLTIMSLARRLADHLNSHGF